MKSTMLWSLVVVNAVLLAALLGRAMRDNAALAQQPPVNRRPGDYILIPGEVTGGSSSVVYILDTTNGLLGGMSYNDSTHRIETMTPIPVGRNFDNTPGGVNPNGPVRPGYSQPRR